MSLKTLIYLKFVITVISFFCLAYLAGNVTESYKKIEEQNKILLDQKKYYEQILKFDEKNTAEKKVLYDIVKATDSNLKFDTESNGFSLTTNVWILLGSFVIMSNVFTYINSKIEKLKSEEPETEKDNFL